MCRQFVGNVLHAAIKVAVLSLLTRLPSCCSLSACPQFTVDNPKGQKTLLGAFEIIVGKEHPELLPRAGHVLKALYDEDLVEEEVILEWADKVKSLDVITTHLSPCTRAGGPTLSVSCNVMAPSALLYFSTAFVRVHLLCSGVQEACVQGHC